MPVPTEPRTTEDVEHTSKKPFDQQIAEERKHQDELCRKQGDDRKEGDGNLDEALEDTFPASDPAVQP